MEIHFSRNYEPPEIMSQSIVRWSQKSVQPNVERAKGSSKACVKIEFKHSSPMTPWPFSMHLFAYVGRRNHQIVSWCGTLSEQTKQLPVTRVGARMQSKNQNCIAECQGFEKSLCRLFSWTGIAEACGCEAKSKQSVPLAYSRTTALIEQKVQATDSRTVHRIWHIQQHMIQ